MPPMDFTELFPHADRSAIELLTRMLAFSACGCTDSAVDPGKRLTVREALESDFVAAVRRPESEVSEQ